MLDFIILISIIFGQVLIEMFSIGLCIMIVMLVSQCVVLEWISVKKLANLNTDLTLIEYSKLAHQFILGEKNTLHPILSFTSRILLVYIAFTCFKTIFSRGFYLYILLSGYIFYFYLHL
jgi:hypothetical protein